MQVTCDTGSFSVPFGGGPRPGAAPAVPLQRRHQPPHHLHLPDGPEIASAALSPSDPDAVRFVDAVSERGSGLRLTANSSAESSLRTAVLLLAAWKLLAPALVGASAQQTKTTCSTKP